jgi:Baseplate J-like protein
MPLPAPPQDNRRYQDLVNELVARIPVHTPEWTNFNNADPGITLIQLYAHLAESILYRTNQIPDRNRQKFLQLLGVPLNPAQEAKGIVTFANERGPAEQLLLAEGAELAAGAVPFLTATSLDILPVEARCFVKQDASGLKDELEEYYRLLYASYGADDVGDFAMYKSVEIDPAAGFAFADSIDRTVWIALLGRDIDRDPLADDVWANVREKLGGRTLSLGYAPARDEGSRTLGPETANSPMSDLLNFAVPRGDQSISFDADGHPVAGYQQLTVRADFDPLSQAGIIELLLPPAARLRSWSDLDPLESGVGDLPPAIENDKIADRLITWLKVSAGAAANLRGSWMGINAAQVRQRVDVRNESLGNGDGKPDQQRNLSRAPILQNSVNLVSVNGQKVTGWTETDDILVADPEVPVLAPGQALPTKGTDYFTADAEAGIIRFGDGLTGRRPAAGEALYASYSYSEGVEGNVGAGAIKAGSALPAGVKVVNPIATWGGADAESIASGEKQVRRRVQNRDRLVTANDFFSIAWRTPGVDIGRIEIVPASHPDVWPVEAGTVPGAVTIMAIPAFDTAFPAAPRPDRSFVNAMCAYLDPRRLVTTELAIRGPSYLGIWLSVGVEIAGGHNAAEVTENVRARIKAYLSPLPQPGTFIPDLIEPLYAPETDPAIRGWPLGRAVHARMVLAEVARTAGVLSVANVLLAKGSGPAVESVPTAGLELPELLGISVVIGDPVPLDSMRGAQATSSGAGTPTRRLPVPVLAETC